MNKTKLLGKLAEKGIHQKDLAEHLGIHRNTLSKKLNEDESEFLYSEIIAIADFLELDIDEIHEIFFNNLDS